MTQKNILSILLLVVLAVIFSGCKKQGKIEGEIPVNSGDNDDSLVFEEDKAFSEPPLYKLKVTGRVECDVKWRDGGNTYLISEVVYEYDKQGALIKEFLDANQKSDPTQKNKIYLVYVQYPDKNCLGEVFFGDKCEDGNQVEVFGTVFESVLQEEISRGTGELLVNVCHCSRKFIRTYSP